MRNVKYGLVVLSLMVVAFTTKSWAEDVTAGFMNQCTEMHFESACCERLLDAYSDSIRDYEKRQLPDLEKSTKKNLIIILANSDMTREKIDAVYNLYDSSQEHARLAGIAMGAGDRKGTSEHRNQSNELRKQFVDLTQNYETKTLKAQDIDFYCRNKYKLEQIKKNLEADDGKLYPKVKQDLESNKRVYHQIFTYNKYVKCTTKKP
jgi:hypothetical protein